MYFNKITQKLLNGFQWNFQNYLAMFRGGTKLILSKIRPRQAGLAKLGHPAPHKLLKGFQGNFQNYLAMFRGGTK